MKKANLSLFDHLLMYSPTSSKRKPYRSTQIMATISPEATKEDLKKMVEAGMNIARFDASKGKEDFKSIEGSLKVLREAVYEYNDNRRKESERQSMRLSQVDGEVKVEKPDTCPNVHVATALDLKGSYYETGTFDGAEAIKLEAGSTIALTTDVTKGVNGQYIYVNFPNLLALNTNQVIILRGEMKLSIASVDNDTLCVNCTVLSGGELCPNMKMEVNIPGVKTAPPMNDDVIPLINLCKQMEMDMIIAPINDATTFAMIKCVVNPDGAQNALKVIAKLEGGEAVRNVDKIIERADGVMISRSRLGRNVSPEQVIIHQKSVVAKCLKAGIPSIIGSDMLKSMGEKNCEATRAEIADVVNSVFDGVDCTMLEESVSTQDGILTMSNAILEAEDMINYRRLHWDLVTQLSVPPVPIASRNFSDSIAVAACTAAMINGANAIVVLTETGKTARVLSKYRPECPIICVARTPVVARQVLMCRGVLSITFEDSTIDNYQKNVEERIQAGISFAKSCCLLKKHPGVVIAVSSHVEGPGNSDTVRIIYID